MAKHFQVDTGGTLTTSLVSYYKLDSDSIDFWGSNNGTDTAMSYQSAGKVGNGATFNGSTSLVNFGNVLDAGSGPWSVALWLKTSTTGVSQHLIGKTFNDISPSWDVKINASNLISADISDAVDFDIVTSGTTTVTDGLWHLVIFTWVAGGAMHIYIDNVQADTGSSASSRNTTNTKNAKMGIDDAASPHFPYTGMLDEVGIWTKVLSAQEMTDLWNGGSGQTMVSGGGLFVATNPMSGMGCGGRFFANPLG